MTPGSNGQLHTLFGFFRHQDYTKAISFTFAFPGWVLNDAAGVLGCRPTCLMSRDMAGMQVEKKEAGQDLVMMGNNRTATEIKSCWGNANRTWH